MDKKIISCGCGCCGETRIEGNHEAKASFFEKIKKYIFSFTKIFVSLVLSLVALFLPMSQVAKLILFVISAVVVGYTTIWAFFRKIIKLKFFDEQTLMLIASVVAFVIGEYFEGSMILILFSIGSLLETIAVDNAHDKIVGLAELKSYSCNVITKDGISEVDPKDVEVGSYIVIKKGERVAIDGILMDNYADLDLSAITGEFNPYNVGRGQAVYAGAINNGEMITVKTTKLYEDSTVERIINLVEDSMSKKSKTQSFITKFSKIYTPTVVIIALIIGGIVPLFDNYTFTKWIYKGLNFLIISCPCALVISVPLSYFIGLGSLASKGVLIKGSRFIDLLTKTKTVVFDKTGTVTEGKMFVESVQYHNGYDSQILSVVLEAERTVNHPISVAITKFCKEKGIVQEQRLKNINYMLGKGISANFQDKTILIGNYSLTGCENKEYHGTTVAVTVDGILAYVFKINDKIKKNATKVMRKLEKMGCKLALISGDKEKSVKSVCGEIGIEDFYYSQLPEAKLEVFERIKARSKGRSIYVGDGVNDAPVVASADIGIAMGGLGSQASVQSADVVLMDDNLDKIPLAIKHSKKIKRIVVSNIVFSLGVKFAIMIASIFTFLPVYVAMISDVCLLVLAILNSLRNYKIGKNSR